MTSTYCLTRKIRSYKHRNHKVTILLIFVAKSTLPCFAVVWLDCCQNCLFFRFLANLKKFHNVTSKYNLQVGKSYCCCFIRQLFCGLCVRMARSKHLGLLLELGKACKTTRLLLVLPAPFLPHATFPRVCTRPSKHETIQ